MGNTGTQDVGVHCVSTQDGIVTAQSLGCVGDGVTDDTAAILSGPAGKPVALNGLTCLVDATEGDFSSLVVVGPGTLRCRGGGIALAAMTGADFDGDGRNLAIDKAAGIEAVIHHANVYDVNDLLVSTFDAAVTGSDNLSDGAIFHRWPFIAEENHQQLVDLVVSTTKHFGFAQVGGFGDGRIAKAKVTTVISGDVGKAMPWLEVLGGTGAWMIQDLTCYRAPAPQAGGPNLASPLIVVYAAGSQLVRVDTTPNPVIPNQQISVQGATGAKLIDVTTGPAFDYNVGIFAQGVEVSGGSIGNGFESIALSDQTGNPDQCHIHGAAIHFSGGEEAIVCKVVTSVADLLIEDLDVYLTPYTSGGFGDQGIALLDGDYPRCIIRNNRFHIVGYNGGPTSPFTGTKNLIKLASSITSIVTLENNTLDFAPGVTHSSWQILDQSIPGALYINQQTTWS